MKILVIDDDENMTELLKLMLRSTASAVFVANSGADGIKFTREQPPDLIILDTILPDMDGMQVCKAVREFSSVPILILSGLNTPGAIAEALKSGADDYLAKPVAGNFLLATINLLIQRSHPDAAMINSIVSA